MCETGPQVLSPVRKPNQVDTVTWDVTRDFYTRWRASIVYSFSSTLFLLSVFCCQASLRTDSRSLVYLVGDRLIRNLPPLFGNRPKDEQSSQFSYQFPLLFNFLPSEDENFLSRRRRIGERTSREGSLLFSPLLLSQILDIAFIRRTSRVRRRKCAKRSGKNSGKRESP